MYAHRSQGLVKKAHKIVHSFYSPLSLNIDIIFLIYSYLYFCSENLEHLKQKQKQKHEQQQNTW